MSYELTRQALYDRVWTRPLNRIAPEFATDATRLSGLCKRFGIPTPTAGYWTKKGMGKPVDQPPLGPPPEDVGETVCIEPKPMRAVRAKPPAVEVMEQPVAPGPLPPEPPPSVAPETPDTAPIHKLVLRTHAKVAAAKAGERARVSGRGLFSVFATAVQADRIAVILSQLVRAAEHQGWAVKVDDDGIRIAPDDEPVSLQLTEQTDRIRHVPTEKEAEVVRKHEEKRKIAIRAKQWFSDWDAPKVPEWDYVPNGKLVLTFEEMRWRSTARRTFSDSKYQQLEAKVDAVVQSLTTYAADVKQGRIDAELRRLEGIAAEERWREAQRRRELEAKRIEFLDRQIQRQQRITQIETFIDALASQEAEGGVVADFIAWARRFSARLRRDLSHETLSSKLQKLDLMNDKATISSWVTVD